MIDESFGYATVAGLTAGLRRGDYTVRDVAEHALARIDAVNPLVNAWITVDAERVLRDADALDRDREARERPLYGVPAGIKDLTVTAGLRTTFGSPSYRDHVPDADAVIVERLKRAGALIVGKTNTPEFGVGGNTFNAVAGATRNPWDTGRSAGGSSGGSAAALATGTCVLAEGSDTGGSLRIPAAFCGVVGFRTSPGFVPDVPAEYAWDTISVTGPMARTVDDVEAMLASVAGPHPQAPLSLPWHPEMGRGSRFPDPVRVGWATGRDLVDVDPAVDESVRVAAETFDKIGCAVSEEGPDLGGLEEAILAIRAARAQALYGDLVAADPESHHPGLVKDVERAETQSAGAVIRAEMARGRVHARAARFWERCDVLVFPTTPIPPFPVDWVAPDRIGERHFDVYSEWMILTHALSLMGWPVLALPSTPTPEGLPVGIQLVGPPGAEWRLLDLARRYEEVVGWMERFPPPIGA
jgi:amidase